MYRLTPDQMREMGLTVDTSSTGNPPPPFVTTAESVAAVTARESNPPAVKPIPADAVPLWACGPIVRTAQTRRLATFAPMRVAALRSFVRSVLRRGKAGRSR